jgi:hypothetical protein
MASVKCLKKMMMMIDSHSQADVFIVVFRQRNQEKIKAYMQLNEMFFIAIFKHKEQKK